MQKKKKTGNGNAKVVKTKKGRTMLLSKCTICGSKMSRFMIEQEAKGLLCSLGIKIPVSNIPLLRNILL